jgi:DNA-binding transcriptional MocR family regulator
VPPSCATWPPASDARTALHVPFETAQVLTVCSPVDELNAALAHALGAAGGPVAYAYGTKQGQVRLIEFAARRAWGSESDVDHETVVGHAAEDGGASAMDVG